MGFCSLSRTVFSIWYSTLHSLKKTNFVVNILKEYERVKFVLFFQGEIRLPVVLEDQCHREVPNIQLFYRPVRQMVYAILFNLHHHTFLADKQREQQNEKPETSNVIYSL